MSSSFKALSFFLLTLLALPSFAVAQMAPPAQFNRIYYQFTQERWASTNTAKVTVNFDAALNKNGLDNVNQYVLANLNKIADKAAWHIVEFTRTKDTTELEKLHVVAEARLPDTALAGVRDKAKAISKPGEAYTIADIDFSPSNEELEKAHMDARSAIYEQTKQEIARLNATYPDQKYFLNEIRFNAPQVMPMMGIARVAAAPNPENSFAGAGVAQLTAAKLVSMSVDTKVIEVASVTIASVAPERPANAQ